MNEAYNRDAAFDGNPIYRTLRARFSYEGNHTAGDVMRARAAHEGHYVTGSAEKKTFMPEQFILRANSLPSCNTAGLHHPGQTALTVFLIAFIVLCFVSFGIYLGMRHADPSTDTALLSSLSAPADESFDASLLLAQDEIEVVDYLAVSRLGVQNGGVVEHSYLFPESEVYESGTDPSYLNNLLNAFGEQLFR